MAVENQRADALRRLAVMFQGIVEASDDYDKIGSIKDHIRSLESKRDEVTGEIADEQKKLDAARVLVQNTQAQVSQMLADANAHGQRIVKEAEAVAASTIADADHRASLRMAEIETAMTATSMELQDAVEKLEVEHNLISADVSTAKDTLASLKDEIQKKRVVLEEIESQLAKIDELRKR